MLHRPPVKPGAQPRVPSWILVLVPSAGWLVLATADVMMLILDSPPGPGLHGVFLGMVLALTIGASLVWSRQKVAADAARLTEQVMNHVSDEVANLHRLICRRYAEREAPTEPILRIVGTAAVAPAPSLPLPAAEVIQMPSPATVAAMRRLAEKVIGSTTED